MTKWPFRVYLLDICQEQIELVCKATLSSAEHDLALKNAVDAVEHTKIRLQLETEEKFKLNKMFQEVRMLSKTGHSIIMLLAAYVSLSLVWLLAQRLLAPLGFTEVPPCQYLLCLVTDADTYSRVMSLDSVYRSNVGVEVRQPTPKVSEPSV